jgi:hypothetical protein
MNHKEIVCEDMDLILLSSDSLQGQVLVNTAMKRRAPENGERGC